MQLIYVYVDTVLVAHLTMCKEEKEQTTTPIITLGVVCCRVYYPSTIFAKLNVPIKT